MEQRPSWTANRFPASRDIFLLFWNQRVYYCVYRCPPTVPILSQINPVHDLSYFLKIHLNIILQFTPGPSMWSLSLRFPTKFLFTSVITPVRAACPTHLIILDLIARIIFGEVYRSLGFSYVVFSTLLLSLPS